MSQSIVKQDNIVSQIHFIRGEKVILDVDLAILYGVETKQLTRAVRRNIERFPLDFMFQLSVDEMNILRSQFGTSSWGGRRYRPYAFTEQGVAMLSGVLKSKRAIEVNVEIMRTFVKLRQWLSSYKELERKLDSMEKKYDGQFKLVFEAIRLLMKEESKPKHKIGF